MSYYLWFFGWAFAAIFSFIRIKLTVNGKPTIVNAIIRLIPLIIAFLLMTSNRVGFDIVNYTNRYKYIHTLSVTEPVYAWLSRLFYAKGYTFYAYRAILTLISGVMAVWSIHKIGVDVFDFMVVYFPFFLFVDSMQVRNQVAIFLFIWSVSWLMNNDDLKSRVFFVLSVLFIAQIHVMFYFYLIVLIFDKKYRDKVLNAIVFTSILAVVITWINGNRVPFINQILTILLREGDSRLTRYNTTGRLGFLFPALLLCVMTISLSNSLKVIADNEINITGRQKRFIIISDTINKASFLLIPFTMMNINYYRFMRNAFVFYIISAIILIRNSKYKRKEISALIIAAILVFALWYWFDIIYYNNSNGVSIRDTILKYGEMFWE